MKHIEIDCHFVRIKVVDIYSLKLLLIVKHVHLMSKLGVKTITQGESLQKDKSHSMVTTWKLKEWEKH